MRLHILGICGTFMSGIALLAQQKKIKVSGSDANIYPPMSHHLTAHGITILEGYKTNHLLPHPDLVIIGNTLTRGNPCVEYILNQSIPYTSGPQWLLENVLTNYHVVAVAGTHGKTTVSSLLSWILEYAKLNPGFLIGGLPKNFNCSARLGSKPFFILEADEYDTAFFDKRPKFLHYRPRTLLLNNLEFDHADIFPNLDVIKTQFAYLLRTVPQQGLIICPQQDANLKSVLERGYGTPIEHTGSLENSDVAWQVDLVKPDGSQFCIYHKGKKQGRVDWSMIGNHNAANALVAFAAASHAGIPSKVIITAINQFQGVKRRLEIFKQINGITLYDDFAHHPTAIASTLHGLRKKIGDKKRILVILDPGTHSMRLGVHRETLGISLQKANKTWILQPKKDWDIVQSNQVGSTSIQICDSIIKTIQLVIKETQNGDHIIIMSNSGLGVDLREKLEDALTHYG